MVRLFFTLAATIAVGSAPASVFAQLNLTRLPGRIEDVLINPDLSAVLRGEVAETNFYRPESSFPLPISDIDGQSLRPLPEATQSVGSNRYRPPVLAPAEPDSLTAPGPQAIAQEDNGISFLFGDPANSSTYRSQPGIVAANQGQAASGDSELPPPPPEDQLDSLKVRILGASAMVENETGDLVVEVYNPSNNQVGPVNVSVQVPDEITIARFDRKATLNDEQRTITFELAEIAPASSQKIRLQAVSHNVGNVNFRVAINTEDRAIVSRRFATRVVPQRIAKSQSSSSEPSSSRQ